MQWIWGILGPIPDTSWEPVFTIDSEALLSLELLLPLNEIRATAWSRKNILGSHAGKVLLSLDNTHKGRSKEIVQIMQSEVSNYAEKKKEKETFQVLKFDQK
jgi:hypothetical protein